MKKRYLFMLIAAWIMMFALIPLNLYVFSMSDIIVWAALILVAAATALFIIKSHAKRAGRIAVSVISVVLALCFVLGGIACNPYWNSIFLHSGPLPATQSYDTVLSRRQAQEDLQYAMHYLQKLHPACYHGLPSEVEEKYREVKDEIAARDSITVNELFIDIQSIFALFSDGHTFASPNYSDGLFLKHWYGWDTARYSITAVNGESISDLLARLAPLYSFECESGERVLLRNDLVCLQSLYAKGFDVAAGITYTFENEEGDVQEATYYEEDFVPIDEYYAYNNIDRSSSGDDDEFVYYEIDEEHSVAILTVLECIYDDTYKNTVREMFTQVRDLGIRNVAVDVRNNSGGNDGVVSEFLHYLDVDSYNMVTCDHRLGFLMFPEGSQTVTNRRYEDLTFTGNVYVLTTPITFSSAMIFAQYIKDNHLGTVIGQAPGNNPNGYGDVAYFSLPNSGIFMQISTKKWYRADRSNTDLLVEPDIECNIRLRADAMEALYNAIEQAEA